MARQNVVYGYGDERPNFGFQTADEFRKYISEDIFNVNKGRHRYTQGKQADIVVLSRKGLAHGHFEVEGIEAPNNKDRTDYPPVTHVYIVRAAALYAQPVGLADFAIKGIQFGKYIDEEQFQEIQDSAGEISHYA